METGGRQDPFLFGEENCDWDHEQPEDQRVALAFREYRLGPFKMDFLNWCLTAILGIFIILLLLMRSACRPVIANGSSMEPTIHNGCVYVTNADFSERDLVYGVGETFQKGAGTQ